MVAPFDGVNSKLRISNLSGISLIYKLNIDTVFDLITTQFAFFFKLIHIML